MQDYTKGLEAAEAAILFSEGEMDSTGLYTPGQVYEVDAEAAEFDPELAELGDELNSWIQQGERMSCAVAGQTMVVNQLENGYYSEGEFLEIAKAGGMTRAPIRRMSARLLRTKGWMWCKSKGFPRKN